MGTYIWKVNVGESRIVNLGLGSKIPGIHSNIALLGRRYPKHRRLGRWHLEDQKA
jgi:hypothetical protein